MSKIVISSPVNQPGRWSSFFVRRPGLALGLGQRILLSVSVSSVVLIGLFGLLAMTTLNQVVDAAGAEQVRVAQTFAQEVGENVAERNSSTAGADGEEPLLPTADVPPALSVQVVSSNGAVLVKTYPAPMAMDLGSLAALRRFEAAGEPGYLIHRPGPFESFPPHVIAYAPVPGHPELGVIVQQSQTLVMGASNVLLWRLVVGGFVAILLFVVAAWTDVQQVVRPLQALTAAAEHFASGELTEPIEIERTDEIGNLASSFEIMRRRLQRLLAETATWNQQLEQRVAERTAELERRNQQLSGINKVTEPLTDNLDVAALLDRTLDRIREVIDFDTASYRLTTSDRRLSLAASRNLPIELRLETVALGQCLCGRAALREVCQPASNLGEVSSTAPCYRTGIVSAVAIPLVGADRVEGTLFLGFRQERRFDPGELATLQAIGRQVGMSVANARLFAALERRERERAQLLEQVIVAQEEERRRIASDLHDDVAQALASILLGVESALPTDEQSRPTPNKVDQLKQLIVHTLEDVHTLAAELRPSLLDDIGLVAALSRLVDEVQRQSLLVVDFQSVNVDGLRLLPAAETALFRIAQAALNNVVRHAAAHTASVLLQRRGDRLILVVEDDGKGFDVSSMRAAPLRDRLGLAGIEERARLIGAQTTIESSVGRGTTVHVDLSVSENLPREHADAKETRPAGG